MKSMLLGVLLIVNASADNARIYYGAADDATAGKIDAKAVFARIPEYQEIARKGYTNSDPEYWILLERANRRFHTAVHRAARRHAIEAVYERDGAPEAAQVDITDDVITSLPR